MIPVSEGLRRSVEQDRELSPRSQNATGTWIRNEVYRRKLLIVAERLRTATSKNLDRRPAYPG